MIEANYLMYVSNTEQLIPHNVKYFWSFVSSLKMTQCLPRSMNYDNKELNDQLDIANAFADHFESCYKVYPNIGDQGFSEVESVDLSTHYFSVREVAQNLDTLDKNKSTGLDGIPAILLKNCSLNLAPPLCSIFQASFNQTTFPKAWKSSSIVPIFKSGLRNEIANYRGISLLPVMSKVFESIITDEIFERLKHHILEEQHGFFKGRSTATNLGIFQNYLFDGVESGFQVDVIYTDLTKAFDRVSHSLLIEKLKSLGLRDGYINWIKSYLTDRKQQVKFGTRASREIHVTSGVPQGSHLGPVLFLLYINSVSSVLKNCKFLLYADDLKLFSVIKTKDDCVKVQEDLTRLNLWCINNCLELNVAKCKVMRFLKCKRPVEVNYFVNDTFLEVVDHFSDLGVIFSNDLSFNRHIDSVVLKASRMIGFIRRTCMKMFDTKAIKSLYNCLVLSVLEYNSVIWSPYYQCHKERLERVQNKFVKFLLYKYRFSYKDISYSTRITLAGMQSLEQRRKNAMALFTYKLLNHQIQCPQLLTSMQIRIPQRTTRTNTLFAQTFHRTNYGSQNFSHRLMCNFNEHYNSIDIFRFKLEYFRAAVKTLR